MPESLLTILKFLLLALLYLFFLRVLRAVWAEVRSPAAAAGGAGGGRAAAPTVAAPRPGRGDKALTAKLRIVEPAASKGQAFDVGAEDVKIGRSSTCDVRLDDTYASQLHARVFRQDGQVFVEDSGSTNGTYLTRKGTQHREKVGAPMPLRPGDLLYIGKTVLEATAK